MTGLVRLARRPAWPGYFGSPRLATAARGEEDYQGVERVVLDLALRILNGLDERSVARDGDEIKKSPADVTLDGASLAHEAKTKARQQAWRREKAPAR